MSRAQYLLASMHNDLNKIDKTRSKPHSNSRPRAGECDQPFMGLANLTGHQYLQPYFFSVAALLDHNPVLFCRCQSLLMIIDAKIFTMGTGSVASPHHSSVPLVTKKPCTSVNVAPRTRKQSCFSPWRVALLATLLVCASASDLPRASETTGYYFQRFFVGNASIFEGDEILALESVMEGYTPDFLDKMSLFLVRFATFTSNASLPLMFDDTRYEGNWTRTIC